MSSDKKKPQIQKVTREVEVKNKLGIHARPASLFVRLANKFNCNVYVEKDGEKVNGKSIMGLMMLAAGPGSKIKIHTEGADALKAAKELTDLVERNFDEE
jgi:phosphocarrier protein